MKENNMGNAWHAFIISILHILLKRYTQNYHSTSLRKSTGGWEVSRTILLMLPKNWVICIENGGLNNFAQVTTILEIFIGNIVY